MSTIDTESFGDGRVEPRELADEMRASYLDYAMSVIVGRALPDVRDGLKPVHRRVLFAMSELGLQPNRPYVKCAKVVGETMGSYHPHGDSAIYDTLVRLAQSFSSRYPLVDGQGNFGNVDGYPAAAMRYTECRLSPLATQMLRELHPRLVDYGPNYDGSRQQPLVLPSRFPNLLVNGSSGIAVGMATNIPPHNLGETIDATVALIDDPDIDVEGLMQHLKGPDFPTGGIIMGSAGVREAYETGRGKIRVRARTEVEELPNGRTAIVVTELPFTVRKGGEDGVIVKIAQLVRDKVITEIATHRQALLDQSSARGMRIVIELKADAVPTAVLAKLFRHTALQSTFGVNMVALVDNVPRTLGLRDLLRHYVAHQKDVITRRTKWQLEQAEARAHLLEGYLVALDNLDAVIDLIRASPDAESARSGLMGRFELSELQAQAILDLRLQRLTGLEQDRIRAEHAELTQRIADLRGILGDERRVFGLVKDELLDIRAQYADARRTEISAAIGDIDYESTIPDDEQLISITNTGYVKRVALDTYRAQRRGGVGILAMDTKEDDWIEHLFVATAHDYVLFFTSVGKVYRVKAWELPEAGRQARGRALVNVLPLVEGERVMAVFRTRDYTEGQFLVMGTKRGIVKKTLFKAYDTVLRADGIRALTIREDDELVDVRLTDGDDRIMMISRQGRAVSFWESDVRPMGRPASGVLGMRLRGDDEVVALRVPGEGDDLLVVTENGYGKRTPLADYPTKGRGTMGVLTVKITEARGRLVGALGVSDDEDVMVITERGIVTRQPVAQIPRTGRNTQGVIVQRLREDDRIAAIALVRAADEADDETSDADIELPAEVLDPAPVLLDEVDEPVEEGDVEEDLLGESDDVELVDESGEPTDEIENAVEDDLP